MVATICGHPAVSDLLRKAPALFVFLASQTNKLSACCLQVLYLHGNKITKVHEVQKLVPCQHLTKLTHTGNPISENLIYKLHGGRPKEPRKPDFGCIINECGPHRHLVSRGH
jgi:hypothetical protein